ncbi:hypothetical protein BU16DRAFT_538804 [Lophium mytilinum]|uniref:Uncharacterized protein n=1 Tax=Lophium mytilinum TaxID=390894 RepID=A0A6A6QX39_9PEZI|nr:hypothetical protein BU16DRAFT_538804 [Lophium mytilinum]
MSVTPAVCRSHASRLSPRSLSLLRCLLSSSLAITVLLVPSLAPRTSVMLPFQFQTVYIRRPPKRRGRRPIRLDALSHPVSVAPCRRTAFCATSAILTSGERFMPFSLRAARPPLSLCALRNGVNTRNKSQAAPTQHSPSLPACPSAPAALAEGSLSGPRCIASSFSLVPKSAWLRPRRRRLGAGHSPDDDDASQLSWAAQSSRYACGRCSDATTANGGPTAQDDEAGVAHESRGGGVLRVVGSIRNTGTRWRSQAQRANLHRREAWGALPPFALSRTLFRCGSLGTYESLISVGENFSLPVSQVTVFMPSLYRNSALVECRLVQQALPLAGKDSAVSCCEKGPLRAAGSAYARR